MVAAGSAEEGWALWSWITRRAEGLRLASELDGVVCLSLSPPRRWWPECSVNASKRLKSHSLSASSSPSSTQRRTHTPLREWWSPRHVRSPGLSLSPSHPLTLPPTPIVFALFISFLWFLCVAFFSFFTFHASPSPTRRLRSHFSLAIRSFFGNILFSFEFKPGCGFQRFADLRGRAGEAFRLR